MFFDAPHWGEPHYYMAWKALDQFAQGHEPRYRRRARRELVKDRNTALRIATANLREERAAEKQIPEDVAEEYLRQLEQQLKGDREESWRQTFMGLNTALARAVLVEMRRQVELRPSLSVFNERIVDALQERANLLSGNVTDATFEAIKDEIETSLREGENTREAASRIRSVFDDGHVVTDGDGNIVTRVGNTQTRSNLIARTETTAVTNAASLASAEESDLDKNKIWMNQGDDRVRPAHIAVTNAVVPDGIPLGDVFPVTNLQYPQEPNCLVDGTEVLTRDRGWTDLADLEGGEEIFSLNKDTHEPFWQPFLHLVEREHVGEVIRFKDHKTDLVVTPNHRMYRGRPAIKTVDGLQYKYFDYGIEHAGSLANRSEFVLPRTVQWSGEHRDEVRIGDTVLPACLFMRLMGWFLSEGSTHTKTENNIYAVIAQDQVSKVVEDLSGIPGGLNVGGSKVYICNHDLREYLRRFGHAHEKYVPEVIKSSSPKLIREFLDVFLKGDGHARTQTSGYAADGGYESQTRNYFTSSKQLAADLGELLFKVGKCPSYYLVAEAGKTGRFRNGTYRTNHDVIGVRETSSAHTYRRSYAKGGLEVSRERYSGLVRCVVLPEHDVFLARYNGKCIWTGNCRCFLIYTDPPE